MKQIEPVFPLIKKKFFTLLEIVIAAALTALLLSILLGAYFQSAKTAEVYGREEEELFLERYLQHRLEEVLRTIPKIDQKENFFFSSKGEGSLPGSQTLLFSYDNGISMDSNLSGPVLGRLYVDLEGGLTLITWPDRKEWGETLPPFHREVLARGVRKISFEFLRISNEGSPVEWVADWPKEFKSRPGAIRLVIERTKGENSTSHSFVFIVPKEMGVIRLKK